LRVSIVLNIVISLLFASSAWCQKITVIAEGGNADSSFYHITKIGDNEFWVAGENGVLKKLDTLGNFSNIYFPNEGLNILKIQKAGNYIFLLTDNATIYRFDILTGDFLKKEFEDYKGKCFYDIIPLSDGRLLTCGGTKGISKGERRIPKGFIAVLDKDLIQIDLVWKSYRKFVWSLLELEKAEILAATYNGFNTKIIKSKFDFHWNVNSRIKGLVHEISCSDNQIYYTGSKSNNYKKDGILGLKNQNTAPIKGTGCIWSSEFYQDKIISVSANGGLLLTNKNTLSSEIIKMPTSFSSYDLAKTSESKFFIIGHGGLVYLVDLK